MKKNQIIIKSGTDFQKMTKEILTFCDLNSLILNKGKGKSIRIGIKPNLVAPVPADMGATTHPEIVAGILEYLQESGFTNLVILEGSWVGDRTEESYEACGFRELCEHYQVPFLDMQKEKGIPVEIGDLSLKICEAVTKVEYLINVPVLKGHCQTKVTCALKNMKGLLPNSEKRHFHALGLHKPIAYLSEAIHQDFILVDNICGDLDFEDGGNPVVMNRILACQDPVLTDAYACSLLQYSIEDIPYIGYAAERGIGDPDLSRAELISLDGEKEVRVSARRKVVEVQDQVQEVESCSACYGYLIPALDELKAEGLLGRMNTKICIGQGYRGQTGELGIGNCTRQFRHHLAGCPPLEHEVYAFLKNYLENLEEEHL